MKPADRPASPRRSPSTCPPSPPTCGRTCAATRVSPLVRQLPWTHHLIILGRARPPETRELYILLAIRERWTKRELERQIRPGAACERRG